MPEATTPGTTTPKITTPIYHYIREAVTDGELPDDFSLRPYDRGDQELFMADGAMDGMCIYHMARPELPADLDAQIGSALMLASSGEPVAADEAFSSLANKFRSIRIIDQVVDSVSTRREQLDPAMIYHYAKRLVLTSTDKELLKIGLELFELLREPDDQLKDAMRTLGLSDEFTTFVVFDMMMQWTNGNDEIFRLVQKVHGWGRIHAIERLEPSTDEIRDWFLLEGVNNNIMPAYSALSCFNKSGLAERMARGLSPKEFRGAGTVMEALIDEGPVEGISTLDDPAGILMAYVNQARTQDVGTDDLSVISAIRRYAKDKKMGKVASACDDLLNSPDSRQKVADAVYRGDVMAFMLAEQLGIPYHEELLRAMGTNFRWLFTRIGCLIDDERYIDQALELARTGMPLDAIEQEPRDESGLGPGHFAYLALGFVLQPLCGHVLKGTDIVERALMSPVVRNRIEAHRVLRSWVSSKRVPLAELSPELYARLGEAYNAEPKEDLRQSMRPLLDGAITFPKEDM